ncbi:luciferin 4-monooxygenase-like isoform X2 [Anticarsia gemmatalis]
MLKNKLHKYGPEDGRVPAHLNFGKHIYDNMVKNKHITALINAENNSTMTYEELAQKTVDVALSLARIGVRKGDVVCICSEKRFEVLPTILGIMCAGATFAPTDLTYGEFSLLHRLKIARPKVMFCSLPAYETHKATFKSASTIENYILYDGPEQNGVLLFGEFLTETAKLEEFQPVPVNGWEDHAFMVFSSGTTGLSKGIPVTHLAFLLNSQCIVRDESHDVSILNTREWYYTYGLMYTLSCLRVCATIVYNINPSVENMLYAVDKYKIKGIQMAPSTITELIKSSVLDKYDVSSVEWMVSSSTPIRKEAIDAIKKRMPNLKNVLQLYGMSEGGSITSEIGAPLGCRPGSSGVACLGFEIKVVDIDTRESLGPNQRGEICYKGPSVMKAYLDNVNPDCKDSEGFFKTGDVGYYDDEGYFYIVNRIKELIKYNDISVPPAEFEAVLHQHPAVREAGVVGLPHPDHGEAPVAFIALQPGAVATEQELVEYLHERVTYRMRLAGGVRFIDKLPRGAGDKLNRQELKNMLQKTPQINGH